MCVAKSICNLQSYLITSCKDRIDLIFKWKSSGSEPWFAGSSHHFRTSANVFFFLGQDVRLQINCLKAYFETKVFDCEGMEKGRKSLELTN